jgi:hypothetical protein
MLLVSMNAYKKQVHQSPNREVPPESMYVGISAVRSLKRSSSVITFLESVQTGHARRHIYQNDGTIWFCLNSE